MLHRTGSARVILAGLFALSLSCGSDRPTEPAPAATALGIVVQPPSTAQIGVPFLLQPALQLRSAADELVRTSGVAITASIASGGGTLGGTTTIATNTNGEALFTDLAIMGGIGPRTLQFTSAGLTPATSASIELVAVPATHLFITTGPSSFIQSGVAFTQQPVIQLKDTGGNDAPQAGVLVTAALAAGTGTLGGTATVPTDSNGRAAFTDLAITGAGAYTMSFSAPSLPPATSSELVIATLLVNNTPVAPFSGAVGSSTLFAVEVPAGATQMTVKTTGATGDLDLYVRRADFPTLAVSDCNSTSPSTSEECDFDHPASGVWYILLYGYSAFSGVSVTATYLGVTKLALAVPPADTARSGVPLARQPVVQLQDSAGNSLNVSGIPILATIASGTGSIHGANWLPTDANGQVAFPNLSITGAGTQTLRFDGASTHITVGTVTLPTPLMNGVATSPLSGALAAARWYTVQVPPGTVQLAVTSDSGTGNADLYVRSGQLPTPSIHDCASVSATTTESCAFADPTPGSWYVLLNGTTAYSGVTLKATLDAGSGCTLLSPGDADGDRLPDCAETHTGVFVSTLDAGTDPNDPDTDHDGISDGDEVLGTTLGLDLPAMGVSPLHKDLLIEFDWFDDNVDPGTCGPHSHRPTVGTIAKVSAAMAGGPIANPDGTLGVHLVADYGQGGVFTGGNLIPDADGVLTNGVDDLEYLSLKAGNMAVARLGYFHYALLPHYYDTNSGSSGQAVFNSDDVIVSLYCYGTDQNVANTIVHEIGHNLGLHHGGFDDTNYKPNYNSVMNYKYQFPGVDDNCTPPGDGVLNYSIGDRITLNEANLSELQGTCGSPPGPGWDWNLDGDALDVGLARDINLDSEIGVLADFNDWAHLNFGGIINAYGVAAPHREVVSCPSIPAAYRKRR